MYRNSIWYGFSVALSGTFLMISLVGLNLLGPDAIATDKELIGGTILFLMIYLFLLIGIYFALKKQKENDNGFLTFNKALLIGFLISLSTAIFSVIFTMLFYELISPSYVDQLLNAIKEKMILENIPEPIINEKLAERKDYYSTSSQSMYSFVGNLITGVAFTFLLAFFLKKAPK